MKECKQYEKQMTQKKHLFPPQWQNYEIYA